MILLWLKIVYYKIIKVLKRAEAGTEPHVRARVTNGCPFCSDSVNPNLQDHVTNCHPDEACRMFHDQPCKFDRPVTRAETISPETVDRMVGFSREPGAPDDTIKTERLRRLIALGLVSAPAPDLSDFIRMDQWHEEWARREAGDPSACPCGGRHYPEPDACRWCRCHDLRNVHHTAPARGIMQVIPPDLAADVAYEALSNLFERLGPPPDEIMAVRPSNEIVCCPRCDHPQHGENGGRCAFLVPSADTEGPLPVCRCVWTEDES